MKLSPEERAEREQVIVDVNAERAEAGLPPFTGEGAYDEAVAWLEAKKSEGSKEKVVEAAKTEKKPEQEAAAGMALEAPRAAAGSQGGTGNAVELARIAELERELQAHRTEEGRVAKLDRLLKDAETRIEQAEQRAQAAETKAQELADKQAADADIADLTDEERESLTPEALSVMRKREARLARTLDGKFGKELAETRKRIDAREEADKAYAAQSLAKRQADMWTEVAKSVPASLYSQFPGNAKYPLWFDGRTLGVSNRDLFNKALADADADSMAKLLESIAAFIGTEIPQKSRKPSVMPSETSGGPASSSPADGKPVFYDDDVKRFESDFRKKQLPPEWTDMKANAQIDKFDAARGDGRVIDRATGTPVRN